MANTRAPSTIVTVNLTGQTDFNIPFEYLARKYVELTLLGTVRQPLVLNTDYRFVSKTVVSLTALPSGDFTKLEIRRVTSATERLVDFHDGSILRAYDLNLSQIQTLHVAEEARDLTADTIGVNDDGHLDARGRRVVNMADAVDGRDAVNLGQVITWNDSAYNSAQRAENAAFTAEAANSGANSAKDTAIVYANESARHATDSQASADGSAASAQNAVNAANTASAAATRSEIAQAESLKSENLAATSAATARTEADRAKFEADKLGNWNELAGLVNVSPASIRFDRGLVVVPGATDSGVTIEAGATDWIGLRVQSSQVQYGMVCVGATLEEHMKPTTGSGGAIRRIFSNGSAQWLNSNEYIGTVRHTGAVESCWDGVRFKRSTSYAAGSDTVTAYDYVNTYRVLNEAGQLVGGRIGTTTNVGHGIDLGTDPNIDFAARIHVADNMREPVRVLKPNLNSANAVEMTMDSIITRSNWGASSGSENVWVQHYDDGYLEQGGIVNASSAGALAVTFPVRADEVWNIQITPITDGPRGSSGEANNTLQSYSTTGFELLSGQSKSPCRFMWAMKGRRTTPAK